MSAKLAVKRFPSILGECQSFLESFKILCEFCALRLCLTSPAPFNTGNAFRKTAFSSLAALVHKVLPMRTNAQIRSEIVQRVAVNVVDAFATVEFSSEHSFGNKPMQCVKPVWPRTGQTYVSIPLVDAFQRKRFKYDEILLVNIGPNISALVHQDFHNSKISNDTMVVNALGRRAA